jgi:hypothetical protein
MDQRMAKLETETQDSFKKLMAYLDERLPLPRKKTQD